MADRIASCRMRAVLLTFMVLALSACGEDRDSSTTTGTVVTVVVLDNSFRPQTLEVHVGDEVVWENRGLNEHDVLSIEGGTWGVEVADFRPGASYSHVFSEPGEYRYYCSIHGNETVGMVGTVIVSG